MLADLGPRVGFEYTVAVLPITVVALATTPWIARHFTPTAPIDRIVLPGLCNGDLDVLDAALGRFPVERGPADLRDLPDYFGTPVKTTPDYGAYDIEILAEINHAPRLTLDEILAKAQEASGDGADVIDLGCDPGATWTGVGDAVKALRDEGLRVSLDSFDPWEVEQAAKAGAELVLSVNRTQSRGGVRLGLRSRRRARYAGELRRLGGDGRISAKQRRAFSHRSGAGADRLRLRGVAGPLSRNARSAIPTSK